MADPRIIVALDFNNGDDAISFCKKLHPDMCRVKVGLELYLAAGESVINSLHGMGFSIFLDLKFHDIPNTVAQACKQAARLGVWMVNVHALGGEAMLSAARDAVDSSEHKPLLIAVTVLTSMDNTALKQIGLEEPSEAAVVRLAALTYQCGLDGVVCSAQEASTLRRATNDDFILVTPGIRCAEDSRDDQARVVTPEKAIELGANYLVIGRPIVQAEDPVSRLEVLHKQLMT